MSEYDLPAGWEYVGTFFGEDYAIRPAAKPLAKKTYRFTVDVTIDPNILPGPDPEDNYEEAAWAEYDGGMWRDAELVEVPNNEAPAVSRPDKPDGYCQCWCKCAMGIAPGARCILCDTGSHVTIMGQ